MRERTRVILLMVAGAGISFVFAVLMFFPDLTPSSVYNFITGKITGREASLAVVPFDDTMSLTEGQTATFEDGLAVTFVSVEDTRCAPGTPCPTSGELTVTFDVKHGSNSSAEGTVSQVKLSLPSSPTVSMPPYSFTFLGLEEGMVIFSVLSST